MNCVTYKDLGRSDETTTAQFAGTKFRFRPIDYILVYNDSIAISLFDYDIKASLVKKIAIGKDVPAHHSYYKKGVNGIYYRMKKNKRNSYLLLDSTKNYEWILLDSSKRILDYECKLAFHVTPQQDTLVAWYTTAIPQGYGFHEFNGLPGIVLESISQPMRRHLIAYKIEKIDGEIYFPGGLKTYYYEKRN